MEFTGFHRIEKDLWETKDISKSGPIADKLLVDVKEIVDKANAEKLSPLQLANGAKELLDEVATGKITGEEDRYSHTDLWDFAANLEGSKAAIAALRPVLEERAPDLVKTLDEKFAAVEAALGKHAQGRRLEAPHRADPAGAEGAVGRDQRARRADQQGRGGRRQVVRTAGPRTARFVGRHRRFRSQQEVASWIGARYSASAPPGRPARSPSGRSARRLVGTADASEQHDAGAAVRVPRRAPGRHRHAGPGPAALRRVRRDHRQARRAGRPAAGVDGRRRADDRRARRRSARRGRRPPGGAAGRHRRGARPAGLRR